MGREDPDVAQEIHAILTGEGVEVVLNAGPERVSGPSGDAVAVLVRTADGERTIEGSDLVVAVGRIPNTADIGLDKTGVELDGRGFVRVNECLRDGVFSHLTMAEGLAFLFAATPERSA